jgi:hypothetical protein
MFGGRLDKAGLPEGSGAVLGGGRLPIYDPAPGYGAGVVG